ncbi:MAG: DoxX family protein [Deferribacteres bacterium]|nr:DoxX family protein [candidate division KSB1 bacterium]MCB9512077.1 DoxX family protein [Deferribacteres bacterium]
MANTANFWQKLLATDNNIASTILRIMLGIVIFPHGAQKLLGWFGGYGFTGTMGWFTETIGVPWIFALLAIIAEFFGSLGLITGLLTRVAAFGVGMVMLVATLTVHWQVGFFMNWGGNLQGEGFEFHLLAMAMAVVLMIKGGGAASVDQKLTAAK